MVVRFDHYTDLAALINLPGRTLDKNDYAAIVLIPGAIDRKTAVSRYITA